MNRLKTLILIDDDEIIVYLTKRIIAETNLVELIQVFNNGKDAIDYLTENAANPDLLPEIVFLDLFMPVMDGWQFMEEYLKIKSNFSKQMTIYIITSSVSQEDIIRAKELSDVSDYIIKPVKKQSFIDLIKSL
nr:response regulator [uncultured Flavobacterium sp.]